MFPTADNNSSFYLTEEQLCSLYLQQICTLAELTRVLATKTAFLDLCLNLLFDISVFDIKISGFFLDQSDHMHT